MNCNVGLVGNLGCFARWHDTSGVVAVGKENKYALLGLAVLELFDRQSNCVANHSLRACHACVSVGKNLQARIMVEGKGCYGVSGLAEDDQSDAVVLTLTYEFADDLLYSIDAPHAFAVGCAKVWGFHRLRDVECKH